MADSETSPNQLSVPADEVHLEIEAAGVQGAQAADAAASTPDPHAANTWSDQTSASAATIWQAAKSPTVTPEQAFAVPPIQLGPRKQMMRHRSRSLSDLAEVDEPSTQAERVAAELHRAKLREARGDGQLTPDEAKRITSEGLVSTAVNPGIEAVAPVPPDVLRGHHHHSDKVAQDALFHDDEDSDAASAVGYKSGDDANDDDDDDDEKEGRRWGRAFAAFNRFYWLRKRKVLVAACLLGIVFLAAGLFVKEIKNINAARAFELTGWLLVAGLLSAACVTGVQMAMGALFTRVDNDGVRTFCSTVLVYLSETRSVLGRAIWCVLGLAGTSIIVPEGGVDGASSKWDQVRYHLLRVLGIVFMIEMARIVTVLARMQLSADFNTRTLRHRYHRSMLNEYLLCTLNRRTYDPLFLTLFMYLRRLSSDKSRADLRVWQDLMRYISSHQVDGSESSRRDRRTRVTMQVKGAPSHSAYTHMFAKQLFNRLYDLCEGRRRMRLGLLRPDAVTVHRGKSAVAFQRQRSQGGPRTRTRSQDEMPVLPRSAVAFVSALRGGVRTSQRTTSGGGGAGSNAGSTNSDPRARHMTGDSTGERGASSLAGAMVERLASTTAPASAGGSVGRAYMPAGPLANQIQLSAFAAGQHSAGDLHTYDPETNRSRVVGARNLVYSSQRSLPPRSQQRPRQGLSALLLRKQMRSSPQQQDRHASSEDAAAVMKAGAMSVGSTGARSGPDGSTLPAPPSQPSGSGVKGGSVGEPSVSESESVGSQLSQNGSHSRRTTTIIGDRTRFGSRTDRRRVYMEDFCHVLRQLSGPAAGSGEDKSPVSAADKDNSNNNNNNLDNSVTPGPAEPREASGAGATGDEASSEEGGRVRSASAARRVEKEAAAAAVDAERVWTETFDQASMGHVTASRFHRIVLNMFEDRRNIGVTLQDSRRVIKSIDYFTFSFALVLVFLLSLALYAINFLEVWIAVSSAILGFSFVFGSSMRVAWENVLFLFVQHPYDVGDSIAFPPESVRYVVRRINLYTTEIVRWDGSLSRMDNSKLAASAPVWNYSTSDGRGLMPALLLDLECVTPAFIERVLADLRAFVKANPDTFTGEVDFNARDLRDPCKMYCAFYAELVAPFGQDVMKSMTDQSNLNVVIGEILKRHGARFTRAYDRYETAPYLPPVVPYPLTHAMDPVAVPPPGAVYHPNSYTAPVVASASNPRDAVVGPVETFKSLGARKRRVHGARESDPVSLR